MGNIYRLAELNVDHREQQRKLANIKSDIWHARRTYNQGKQITLCKVTAHIRIKGNKEADKAAKPAIDMPGMTTTRLLHTDYIHQDGYKFRVAKGVGKQYK